MTFFEARKTPKNTFGFLSFLLLVTILVSYLVTVYFYSLFFTWSFSLLF